ncbi:hypothetical protein [Vibrio phage VCPH]|nr:hypothetical protein [Vibrio phage VCPH]
MKRTPYNVTKAIVVFVFMLACMTPCVVALLFTKLGAMTGNARLVNLHREYSHSKTLMAFVQWGAEDLDKLGIIKR